MRPLILILPAAFVAMAWIFFRDQPQPGSVNEAKPVKPAPPVITSMSAGGESPKHYRPATLPESVRRKADAVAARHRGMSKAQFEQSAEMHQLGAQFSRHLESPEFQAKLKQAIEAMKAVKGIEHGTLSFDLHDLSSPNARAWLTRQRPHSASGATLSLAPPLRLVLPTRTADGEAPLWATSNSR